MISALNPLRGDLTNWHTLPEALYVHDKKVTSEHELQDVCCNDHHLRIVPVKANAIFEGKVPKVQAEEAGNCGESNEVTCKCFHLATSMGHHPELRHHGNC